jgi:vacuolar-type H+-ATPase subunit H
MATLPDYLKSAGQQKKERRTKSINKAKRKVKKVLTKGRIDTTKVKKKAVTTAKKVGSATKKVAKTTGQKIKSAAVKSAKSPVTKLGAPLAIGTAAYFLAKEFPYEGGRKTRGQIKNKKTKASTPKVKIDKKGLTPARTLAKGESKISKATMMGGTPFGMPVDEKKKAKKYDPTKANRAGQRFGQRKDGGMTNLKPVAPEQQKSLGQLPEKVRNRMGYAKKGTMVQARGCGMARKKPTKLS